MPNKKAKTAARFVRRALRWFWVRYRIKFKAILTDNGKEFSTHIRPARPLHAFEIALVVAGIKHRYTRPYRPQTNGKAEAFWTTIPPSGKKANMRRMVQITEPNWEPRYAETPVDKAVPPKSRCCTRSMPSAG